MDTRLIKAIEFDTSLEIGSVIMQNVWLLLPGYRTLNNIKSTPDAYLNYGTAKNHCDAHSFTRPNTITCERLGDSVLFKSLSALNGHMEVSAIPHDVDSPKELLSWSVYFPNGSKGTVKDLLFYLAVNGVKFKHIEICEQQL